MSTIYIHALRLREPPAEGSYLSALPIVKYLRQTEELPFPRPVTFLVGENGTGKSTLLEAIAVASGFNPEGGSRDFRFATRDSHSELYQLITTVKKAASKDGFFLRAESFYNMASYLDETTTPARYGGRSFHEQSHGESFLALALNRFEGHGLYLLDEPEAALSPQSVMTLLCRIHDLVQQDSQFIIATHSPILMAYPGAQVLELTQEGIAAVDYRETAHYRLTKRFMDAPEMMMKRLLG